MIRLGYACINTTLSSASSTMRRATFDKLGISYAGEIIVKNLKNLLIILDWNKKNNINVYRMSSEIMPWASEYNLQDLPQFPEILQQLRMIGAYAKYTDQRLTFHPGQFNCLGSDKENVILNSIKDLEIHAEIMDLMGLSKTPFNKINIHLGSACNGQHKYAMENFCRNFERLSDSVKSRLTLENDDKKGMFSVKMLYDGIYKKVGVPIVYDQHHFQLGPQDSTQEEAIHMAYETWKGIRPVCHHSNSRKTYEDPSVVPTAHSDYYYEPFVDYNLEVDVVLEAKMKEQALIRYRNTWGGK